MIDRACAEWELLIQADLDNELDAESAARLSAHIDACPNCAATQAKLLALSARLRSELPRHAAPPALRRSLEARLAPRRRPRFRFGFAPALGFGAGAALAAGLALVLLPRGGEDLTDQLVAGHIRALQPGHLTDVVSSDQHTVKPWFDGRLDYAPPVRDFAASGFPLVGGRLDYLAGRPVAVLVYGRDRHLIDLYVWPAGSTPALSAAAPSTAVRNGYNVVSWTAEGMNFRAVSDLEMSELETFARLLRAGS
jgi:anti-sigma factor RsiW